MYKDREVFDKALNEYHALRKRIPRLEEEWYDITQRIEAEIDGQMQGLG